MVLRNDSKQESQLTRFRRSVSYHYDIHECYRYYFVGTKPPTGFPLSDYKHICQGKCVIATTVDKGCFSTLYDLNKKIPIYSAYVVRKKEWAQIDSFSRSGFDWRKETPVTVLGEPHLYLLVIYLQSRNFLKNTP